MWAATLKLYKVGLAYHFVDVGTKPTVSSKPSMEWLTQSSNDLGSSRDKHNVLHIIFIKAYIPGSDAHLLPSYELLGTRKSKKISCVLSTSPASSN